MPVKICRQPLSVTPPSSQIDFSNGALSNQKAITVLEFITTGGSIGDLQKSGYGLFKISYHASDKIIS